MEEKNMNRNRSSLYAIVLFALAVAFGVAAAHADELMLTVHAEEAEVAAGVPVTLAVSLSPRDPGGHAVVHAISPAAGNVHIHIKHLATGEQVRYLGPQWGVDEREPEHVTVTAHDPHQASIALLHHNVIEGRDDLEHDALPLTPGRYRITVEYVDSGVRAEGSTIVTVREPESDAEKMYWHMLQANPTLAESLQLGSFARHDDLLGTGEELLAKFPDAPQAALTALAVGSYHLHVRHDPARAEDLLTSSASLNADGALRGRIQRELAAALIAQQKIDEAKDVLEHALPAARDHQLATDLRALQQIVRAVQRHRNE
jgi:hypothetical protein